MPEYRDEFDVKLSGTAPAVRTCPNCNAEVAGDSTFCYKCGRQIASGLPSDAGVQGQRGRPKPAKTAMWVVATGGLLIAMFFILALAKKSIAEVYMPVAILLGVLVFLAGFIMLVIGLFRKKWRVFSGSLATWGVILIVMAAVVGIANPEGTTPDTSVGHDVKVSPASPSATQESAAGKTADTQKPASGDNLTEVLGRAAKINSAKFDLVTTFAGEPPVTEKIWVKGNALLAETSVGGQPLVVLLERNTRTVYTYDPAQKVATRETLDSESNGMEDFSPAGAAKKISKQKPVVVGSEKINGEDSLVVEATGEDGQKYRAWIWKQYGFTVRAEADTPQGKAVIEWKNIKFDVIDDSLFRLPPGTLITASFKEAADAFVSNVDVPTGARVYGVATPFLPGTQMTIKPDFFYPDPIVFRPANRAYFFFVDDAPGLRFTHPVRYIVFEETREGWSWTIWNLTSLPTVNGQSWEVQQNMNIKGKQVTVLRESRKPAGGTSFRRPAQAASWSEGSSNRFLAIVRENLLLLQTAYAQANSRQVAIVLDGSEPPRIFRNDVAEKFYGDAEGMAAILRSLGYDTQFYSGLAGKHTLPLDSKTLENHIAALSRDLREGDSFVLYLGGHGNRNGFALSSGVLAESLFSPETSMVWYQDLAQWLKKVDPKVKVEVYIDACESGGAVDHIKKARPGTTVITATDDKTLTPVGTGGEKSLTDHAREGFQGKAADADNNGKIVPVEAFSYATVQNNRGGATVSVLAPPTTGTVSGITSPPVTGTNLAGKPDLTVTSVSFSPSSGKAGQALSVTFTVKNQGGAVSVPFSYRLSLATAQYGTTYSLGNFEMEPLTAGQTKTITAPASVVVPSSAPAGSYWVTVFVDGFQKVDESDENNNIGSSSSFKFALAGGTNVYQFILDLKINSDGVAERSYERTVTQESAVVTLKLGEFRLGAGGLDVNTIRTSSTGNTYQYNGSLNYYRHPDGPRYDPTWVLQAKPGGQYSNSGDLNGYVSGIPVAYTAGPPARITLRATNQSNTTFQLSGWKPEWGYLWGPYTMANYTLENILARDHVLNPAGETIDINGNFSKPFDQVGTQKYTYTGKLTLKLLRQE